MGDTEDLITKIEDIVIEDKTEIESEIGENKEHFINGAVPTPVVQSEDLVDTKEPVVNGVLKKDEDFPQENGVACTLAPANDYWTTDRDGAVKIRFSGIEGHCNNGPALSVMELVDRSVNKYSSRTALKVERDGDWKTWTYQEYMENVKIVGKAFIKLGLEPYHGVGIIGFNSPEWLFSDLGAIFAGGFACGIYATNNAEACQYVCADAGCNIVVAENDAQLQKILQIWDQLPKLKAVVQYSGEIKEKRDNIYSWEELMKIGKAESVDELEKRMKGQSPNRCCTLIYTSGTTGNPKGVMVSHDNIFSIMCCTIGFMKSLLDPDSEVQEHCISYLPLSHIAAQLTDIWMPLYLGACLWFARPDALKGSLGETLRAARPTLFVGVPRVFEKIEEKMKGIGATIHGIKRKIADWAKGIALQGNQNIEAGKPLPYGWTLANYLVLGKIRKALGLDRVKLIFTAAAPISKSTLEYFQSINVPLFELYGMSEGTGPMTLNMPCNSRITSIGQILPINEAKVLHPDKDGSGELCFRGRNIFMGYLNNPDKTKESLDEEGWLHSGDVGKIDQDGFFFITGRIKEIIVTAGGENVAPVPIEEKIKTEIPFISSAMVIGDRKKFLSCLLTCQVEIDLETGMPTDKLIQGAQQYCSTLGLKVTKASEIAPDVPYLLKQAIQDGIDKINKKAISNATKVQKWKLLPFEFTTANGELGPTQKLRRPHVMKMHKQIIDEFYAC